MKQAFLVIGCPGSGKSYVCEQLKDVAHYVHHDLSIGMAGDAYVNEIVAQAETATKPLLIEAPFSVSEIKEPLEAQGFTVTPVFIQEDHAVIAARYRARDGKDIPVGHLTRQDTYMARATEWQAFAGTSDQVAAHLKKQLQHEVHAVGKLTKEARAALSDEMFAFARTRDLPLHDADHVKMAMGVFGSINNGATRAERAEARRRIMASAAGFGIETRTFEAQKVELQPFAFPMQAMSLNMPTGDHPNRMPFSGVLTRIDQPSDTAPHGSDGKRVMLTREAATAALDTLLGMGVNYNPTGHSPQVKVGIIDDATIEGDAVCVKGFIYAADFPAEAAEIKKHKDVLGMSFEARSLMTDDPEANPVPIVDCVFTGAAILLKDKAAYTTTSISAATEAQEDFTMTNEELKAIVADAVKPLAQAVEAQGETIKKMETERMEAANHLQKVEKHAVALEKEADNMDAAGIGGDPVRGHAVVLRKMAGDLRANAAVGKLPHIFDGFYAAKEAAATVDVAGEVKKAVEAVTAETTKQIAEVKAAAEKAEKALKDELASEKTKLADLQAKADKAAEDAGKPTRVSLSSSHAQMLAKSGVQPDEKTGKVDKDALNAFLAKSGLTPEKRIEFKAGLRAAGLLG